MPLGWGAIKEVAFVMKKLTAIMMSIVLAAAAVTGCGASKEGAGQEQGSAEAQDAAASEAPTVLEDGVYTAEFNTDSSMFHVNDTKDGRGILIVTGGRMAIHVLLLSTNIVNLYYGTAEDAQKEGAELLKPSVEYFQHSDGTWDEANSFNIPVPYLDKEYDVALIGTKGKWYDHKVSVTKVSPLGEPLEESDAKAAEEAAAEMNGSAEAGGTGAGAGESSADADKKAADEVAAKIDAIYVQKWTEDTDQMCADARKSWDALTDAQKALVEGQFADPDYFGRDTGDASLDDPLNADEIGEKELLVVSFGTSFNDSRAGDIGGIEKALQAAYPDWAVRRAFTSQIILNHINARDGERIDNVEQALERAAAGGVKRLVIQPTHLMQGAEFDELSKTVDSFRSMFESVEISEPLLGEVGADAAAVNPDKEAVAKAVAQAAAEAAGFDSAEAAAQDGTAFVFMGHGTSHTAKITYSQMQSQMDALGYMNVFIGTVEGEPEDTSCEAVIEKVKAAGFKKVILRPLMVVAGDHANNDMAGEEEDSWLNMFTADGSFEKIDTQIAGLGSIPAVQQIYVEHAAEFVK